MAGNGDRDYLDKTLQQFESYPYPDIPIEDPLNREVSPQTVENLVSRYLQVRPFYPGDLTPVKPEEAQDLIMGMSAEQEEWGLIMIEA
jgi:hypothetical protein